MIKMLVSFISLFIIFYVGIDLFRKFTKKEKWDFVKMAAYSAGISVLVVVVLVGIVILF
jgi:hypothetical protein